MGKAFSTSEEHKEIERYFTDVNKLKLLDREDEHKLALRAKEGDQEAREKLITANLRYVAKIAGAYVGNGLSYLDLVQEGNEALIEAVDGFDPESGYRVTTYATKNIRWGIMRALRDYSRLIRLPGQIHDQLAKLNQAQENTPDHELAQKLDLPEEVIAELKELNQRRIISLDSQVSPDNTTPVADVIADEKPNPEETVIINELQQVTGEEINKLEPKYRKVILGKYYEGVSSDRKLGKKLGISHETVRLHERIAKRQLAQTLRELM
jgi:RNA polymerase sigma factor (sigma-70 family)